MTVICNKFDARIKDLSDIQSFKQYDDKYVGRSGYFSDSFCAFQDLDQCLKTTLLKITDDNKDNEYNEETSDYIFTTEDCGNYRFFLPEELLKESEKKYKVFSLEKFLEIFTVGDLIIYRKNGSTEVHHKMFTGYIVCADGRYDIPGIGKVTLGQSTYGLGYLFITYELFLNGKWQPFGIEE